MTRLSIPAHERLIIALDLPTAEAALALVERIGASGHFYKIGLELLMAPGFFDLLETLKRRDKRVFVDLKFFDIPETVARAIRNLSERGADFATVHGNQAIMESAAAAKSNGLKVLAVTALTSLDQGDLDDLGFTCNVADLVLSRARRCGLRRRGVFGPRSGTPACRGARQADLRDPGHPPGEQPRRRRSETRHEPGPRHRRRQ